MIERAVILSESDRLAVEDLGLPATADEPPGTDGTDVPRTKDDLKQLKKTIRRSSVDEVEKTFLLNALESNDWNVTRAAKATGLQRTNFQTLMKKHGISSKQPS